MNSREQTRSSRGPALGVATGVGFGTDDPPGLPQNRTCSVNRIRLKQAQRFVGRAETLAECRGGVSLPAAPGMYETKVAGLARPAAPAVGQTLLAQRLAGHADPPFPFGWALRRMVGVQEQVPAAWTAPVLRLEQTQGELVHWQGNSSTPPVGPVLGQGGVVRRRRALDHPVSDDTGPGELGQVGAAGA